VILRRVGLALVVALIALIGLWIAALTLLPGAPGGFARMPRTPLQAPWAGAKMLMVPVAGVPRDAIRDSWGDPRDNGLRAHHGTDVIAPANTPVLAAAAGRIEKLWTSVAGGTALYVRSPDRAWTYYYAHLARYAPGLREGQVVKAGDLLGFVGDTGNAGPGNFHLHFGLTRTTPLQHWYEGEDVDPYPYFAGKPLPG
jgi:murein DD-endopeptidase MepM/ murein hydrolase activator NlpD